MTTLPRPACTDETWMEEAERLIDAFGTAMLHNDTDGSERSALLSHLRTRAAPAVAGQTEPKRLIDIGAMFANAAFNLSQTGGEVLKKDAAESLKWLQREWDEALLEYRASLAAPSAPLHQAQETGNDETRAKRDAERQDAIARGLPAGVAPTGGDHA